MVKNAIDFSTPMAELLGGGGQIFNPGLYTVVESDFRTYDFKKPGNDSLCFYMKLQPVDTDGNEEGEVTERYWPTGEKLRDGSIVLEAISPVKGRKGSFSQLAFTAANTHGKIFGKSDFGYFLTACEKAEVDMDSVGNDITAFEGNTYEFGLFNKPERAKTAVEEAESEGEEKKPAYPKQTVVIVSVPGKKSKAAGKAKAKPTVEEEDEPKPAKKGKKVVEDEPETAEDWLTAYLKSEICTEDNNDGAGHMDHKLNVPKWLAKKGCDQAMTSKVMKLYNNVDTDDDDNKLFAALSTLGWKYKVKTKEFVPE